MGHAERGQGPLLGLITWGLRAALGEMALVSELATRVFIRFAGSLV